MSISRTRRFRAKNATVAGRDRGIHYYNRNFQEIRGREAAAAYIDKLGDEYGPAVVG